MGRCCARAVTCRRSSLVVAFGPVSSSRVTVQCTVTFGNPDIADEILNQLNDDARVLELTYPVAGG